jgi:hypothetical protein
MPAPWSREFWEEPEGVAKELIAHELLVRGRINIFAGHFEHGKTTVVGDLSRKWAQSDGPVLYLDWEMGTRRVKKRMKAHGWTYDLQRDRLRYAYSPRLFPRELLEWAREVGPKGLIVFDSFNAAMMAQGIDENSAKDVGEWWTNELAPLTEEVGVTVAMISQVKQSAGAHSTYTQRGTGAVSFGTDVMWLVERFKHFGPDKEGLIRIVRKKDREGVLSERHGFALGGDGEDRIVLRPTDAPKGEPANEAVVEAVMAVLEGTEAQQNGGIASSALVKQIEGYGHGPVMTALEQLKEEGRVDARRKAGTGGGVQWFIPAMIEVPDAPPLD